MTDFRKKLIRLVDIPIFLPLYGIYAVLFLLVNNLGQTSLISSNISFLIAIIASLIISGCCVLLIHPISKAYLAASLLNLAFFTYGHIFYLIKGFSIGSFVLGRNAIFFPTFLFMTSIILVIILKLPTPKKFPVSTLNIILLSLCIFQIIKIAIYQDSSTGVVTSLRPTINNEQITNSDLPDNRDLDIYYIIIDGLAREDAMKSNFNYSIYGFQEELIKRGFTIPDCAFSNYEDTARSLTSSLNMSYLEDLGIEDSQVFDDDFALGAIFNILHQNNVLTALKGEGYKFVSFRGFFPVNDFTEADYYFNYLQNKQGNDDLVERNFRSLFIQTTILDRGKQFIESHPKFASFLPRSLYEFIAPDAIQFSSRSYQWYNQHMYQFSQLATIPKLPGKKFIYSHFYTTHQPYVLKTDGSLLWPINEDNDGYVAAVQYTTKRILEVIDQIIADSPNPPIIIIQADHGKEGDQEFDKFKILNAYLLPGVDKKTIYPTITPVNTFRIIFNEYFDTNYPLIPDKILKFQKNSRNYLQVPVSCDLK
jgi:hypothetical protein